MAHFSFQGWLCYTSNRIRALKGPSGAPTRTQSEAPRPYVGICAPTRGDVVPPRNNGPARGPYLQGGSAPSAPDLPGWNRALLEKCPAGARGPALAPCTPSASSRQEQGARRASASLRPSYPLRHPRADATLLRSYAGGTSGSTPPVTS